MEVTTAEEDREEGVGVIITTAVAAKISGTKPEVTISTTTTRTMDFIGRMKLYSLPWDVNVVR